VREVHGAVSCYFRDLGYEGCQYRADGLLDRAHFVPQQRIRQVLQRRGSTAEDIATATWDKRTWSYACRAHHHLFDQKRIRLEAEQYPLDMHTWAQEYQFEFRGPRDGWVGLHIPAAA
jgi:hypothetical protein